MHTALVWPCRFWTPESSQRYAKARDYPEVARAAIQEMHRQVGWADGLGFCLCGGCGAGFGVGFGVGVGWGETEPCLHLSQQGKS